MAFEGVIGRTWQVGTIQSDRVLPERLDATYIGEDGEKHRPMMFHRAIFGSYERFIGIWSSIMPASSRSGLRRSRRWFDHRVRCGRLCQCCHRQAAAAGLRAEADLRNEKINYKVREHG